MKITVNSKSDLERFAKNFAQKISPGDIICLEGNLGSGKTTFTNFLVRALCFEDKIQSPTFVIARKYHKTKPDSIIKTINHIDLYRLTNKNELNDLDMDQYFEDKDALNVIEWPEIAKEILDKIEKKEINRVITVKFEYLDENSRSIELD